MEDECLFLKKSLQFAGRTFFGANFGLQDDRKVVVNITGKS
jgi:hypothetical protein